MNIAIIKKLTEGEYFFSKAASPKMANIGLFLTDFSIGCKEMIQNGLTENNRFQLGGNCTYIITKAHNPDAIIGFEFGKEEDEAIINRYSLATAIDSFYQLVAQQAPTIYIIEENGQLIVTDKPTPEIEEYLKKDKI